ncbi:MAG: hypothetical protein ACOZNI_20390 [Myxococcota bacterium]
MSRWPESDDERLEAVLLRVDLHEGRYVAVREYHNVVHHLLRSASAACLLDREADALALIQRACARMAEWVELAANDRARRATFGDLAATRGLLALSLHPDAAAADGAPHHTARALLKQTEGAPAGPVHNARIAAAALVGEWEALRASARLCELSDAGLGVPWRKLAQAIDTKDAPTIQKAAEAWLQEKMEATHTNEWGAYNEVPIEVSGALGLAELAGVPVRLHSNRVLTRFRVS